MFEKLLVNDSFWIAIISAIVGALISELFHYLRKIRAEHKMIKLSKTESILLKTAASIESDVIIFTSDQELPWVRIGIKNFDDSPEFQRACIGAVKKLHDKGLIDMRAENYYTLTDDGIERGKKIKETYLVK
jgi:hypothetical protein